MREADRQGEEEKQRRKGEHERQERSRKQEKRQPNTTLSFDTRSLTERELAVFVRLVSLQTFTILLPPLPGTEVTVVHCRIQIFMWMPRI